MIERTEGDQFRRVLTFFPLNINVKTIEMCFIKVQKDVQFTQEEEFKGQQINWNGVKVCRNRFCLIMEFTEHLNSEVNWSSAKTTLIKNTFIRNTFIKTTLIRNRFSSQIHCGRTGQNTFGCPKKKKSVGQKAVV